MNTVYTPTTLVERWREEPMLMKDALWPNVTFYDKQKQVIHSVRDNVETYVPAGNMLGKDFLSGFVALWFFICFYDLDLSAASVRVITTSVKDEHLAVIWAEIARYIASSQMPLLVQEEGPLVLNHHEIRFARERDLKNPINYLKGQVSQRGEGMQGHHARNTLLIVDEASGVDDVIYTMASTWAKKMLIIGNPHQCNNFFYRGVKAGDLKVPD